MHRTTGTLPPPPVTILMGVWNGAAHLPAQLESIAAQTHRNWHLVCSDDHSTDASAGILRRFKKAHPDQVTLIRGPGMGYSANYLSLINAFGDAGHLCLADQDDIWKPDKIARGLAILMGGNNQAALYCGRRSYWYPETGRITPSPPMLRPCTLRNALIENVAAGNTVMLNPAAAGLAKKAAQRAPDVFAHDWWLYLLITATGGTVTFDNGPPLLLYRQHRLNAIGAGTGLRAQMKRKREVMKGVFSQRIGANLKALADVEDLLTQESRDLCATFDTARKDKAVRRMAGLLCVAPYRQRRRDVIGFWGAASLGRI